MRIEDVLLAHGIGAGPGANFGNGSDGAFNPTGSAPTAMNPTITYSANGYYTTGFNGAPPGTSQTTGPAIGLILDAGTDYPEVPANPPVYTSTTTGTSGYTYGVSVSSNQTIQVKGITWVPVYFDQVVTFTLWQGTTQIVSFQQHIPGIGAASGSTPPPYKLYFPNGDITLNANTTYYLSASISGAQMQFYQVPAANQVVTKSYTYQSSNVYTFNSTTDGAPVVKQFSSVNIPQGALVTVSNRCQGLVMLVSGDVTINGVISMDYMAALVDPTTTPGQTVATIIESLYSPIGNNKFVVIGPGGAGGQGGNGGGNNGYQATTNNGNTGGQGGSPTSGTWWGGGRGGGGGGGGKQSTGGYKGGNGGNATYTGAGAGTAAVTGVASGISATNGNGGGSGAAGTSGAISGSGGNGLGGGGGGGAWSDTSANSIYNGGSVTASAGGMILIIARGNITINGTGVLSAIGSNGGNGGSASTASSGPAGGGGGGGAGGGIVALLYRGTYTNSGMIDVSGGTGGTAGATQTGGSAGTVPTMPIAGAPGLPGQIQVVKIS